MKHRLSTVAIIVLAILMIASCSRGNSPIKTVQPKNTNSGIYSINVTLAGLPAVPVVNVDTLGNSITYGDSFTYNDSVNAALLDAIWADEQSFGDEYSQSVKMGFNPSPIYGVGVPVPVPAEYGVYPILRLISASNKVVSALLPVFDFFPRGAYDESWISVTVEVPSGTVVSLPQLFINPDKGLAEVEALVKKEIFTGSSFDDKWIRSRFSIRDYVSQLNQALSQTQNYQHWALTAGGLAIGFDPEATPDDPSKRLDFTISYAKLSQYLNEFGNLIVSEIRMPVSKSSVGCVIPMDYTYQYPNNCST